MESKGKDTRYPDYPLFRGLQRPLEFMGLQGRYIYWAAGAVGGAILGFIIAYIIAGFVVGLVVLVIAGHRRLCGCRDDPVQAAAGPSLEENRTRRFRIRQFQETVNQQS